MPKPAHSITIPYALLIWTTVSIYKIVEGSIQICTVRPSVKAIMTTLRQQYALFQYFWIFFPGLSAISSTITYQICSFCVSLTIIVWFYHNLSRLSCDMATIFTINTFSVRYRCPARIEFLSRFYFAHHDLFCKFVRSSACWDKDQLREITNFRALLDPSFQETSISHFNTMYYKIRYVFF